jgi:hypothetical protein
MSETKKHFRVMGVTTEGHTMESYAELVERALNELAETGYNVTLRDEEKGLLIVGERQTTPEDILERVKNQMKRMGVTVLHNPRTAELLERFEGATNKRVEDVVANVANLTRGYSHEELEAASKEIGEIAEAHADHACGQGQFYKAVATALKQAAQQNLQ